MNPLSLRLLLRQEQEIADAQEVLDQLERLDYVYDQMKPLWDTIQTNLLKSLP